MKVLFIIDTLTAGGKERRLTELLKGLKFMSGISFELVVMSSDIHYREILDLGIKVHIILRKTKKDITIFRKLMDLLSAFKPDVVHCWDSMTAVYVLPLCKLKNIKILNGMIADAPVGMTIFNKDYLRARLTFPLSDRIVGNSEAGLRAYRAPHSKSEVVHNGFNFTRITGLKDSELLKKELVTGENYLVGMVATFSDNKDYKTYFRAAHLLLKERSDIIFFAIGKETDSDEVLSLSGAENQNNFRLLGRRSDVESLINIMDICVLSTFTEGISNSVLEYMALGKPVIATAGGGTNEIVEDGKTGFLTKTSDPADLAEKIRYLILHPDIAQKMGEEGKKRIEDAFSIQKMVDSYFRIYSQLIT